MDNYTIEWTIPTQNILGEGPVYNPNTNLLYWVDILSCKIYRLNKEKDELNWWNTPDLVGFILPLANGKLVAGLKTGLFYVELMENHVIACKGIEILNEGNESIRVNDGALDSKDGIWACTMDMNNRDTLGCYFYWDEKQGLKKVDDGYVVANGPVINKEGKKLFTVETVGSATIKKGIYVLDLDDSKRKLNKTLLIEWEYENTYPDGIVLDEAGNLWVGEFNGNTIRCFDSRGILVEAYQLPAWNITKICFGPSGEIYATSALLNVDAATLEKHPLTGNLFCFKIGSKP